MAEAEPHTTVSPGRKAGLVRRVLIGAIKRVHAVLLITIVLYLSYRAFMYLIISLLYPSPAPPQVLDLPLRANASMLREDGPAFVGMRAVEHPRAPLGHYHRVDEWFQPDKLNGCTTSGCHAPLPHGRNKADRAFLNMHATSLHCGVCHIATDEDPLSLAWYDLTTGEVVPAPALLAAYGMLDGLENTPDEQTQLVSLLRQAAEAAGNEQRLGNLADHIAAVRVGSAEWDQLIAYAKEELPRHFRGEYGAKLALVDRQTHKPILSHPGGDLAAQEFRAHGNELPESERQELLLRVHPKRRNPTLHCRDCHRDNGLVDLKALGYPPARIHQLEYPLITQMIDHIVAGEPFMMPSFISTVAHTAARRHPGTNAIGVAAWRLLPHR